MRSNKDLMQEILQRKAVYLARKQAHRLMAAGAVLAALLVTMLSVAPGTAGSEEQYTAYAMGAMIFGPKTGSYVIVALLAFSLGIVVTLLIQKRRTIKNMEEEKPFRTEQEAVRDESKGASTE